MSNEYDAIAKPITGWAVEINGKIQPNFIQPSRKDARWLKKFEETYGNKAKVRKVEIKVIEGAR